MVNVPRIMALSLLLVLISCGNSGGGSGSSSESDGFTQNETIMPDGSNVQGTYETEIYPVNYNLHLKNIGNVTVKRDGDNFSASVNMKYGPLSTNIIQAIYTGRRCPNINDDLNKDAYIDIVEARYAIGLMSIPLDGDLNSQMGGYGAFPTGDNVHGQYVYNSSASFERLFSDLKALDENPNDHMMKLGEDEGLTFPGRVVLFQGLHEGALLPLTVATEGGLSAHQSIPVGCGILWKAKPIE